MHAQRMRAAPHLSGRTKSSGHGHTRARARTARSVQPREREIQKDAWDSNDRRPALLASLQFCEKHDTLEMTILNSSYGVRSVQPIGGLAATRIAAFIACCKDAPESLGSSSGRQSLFPGKTRSEETLIPRAAVDGILECEAFAEIKESNANIL
eukprot:5615047-Pleurochrysis_carterae.AAC.2